VLELVDADWNGAIGAHEQSGVRCHRATGRDLVEIDCVDAVRGCTGSQQSALADGAGARQDNDRLLLGKLTDDGSFPGSSRRSGVIMPDQPPRNAKIVGPVSPNRSHVRAPDRLLSRVPGDDGGHGRDRSGRRLGRCRTRPAKGGFVRTRYRNAGPPLADGYQALGTAESCAAQDVRRPAVLELVADIAARDRRRTLPELHHFARRLGVPA
jgi:hypothetical protein